MRVVHIAYLYGLNNTGGACMAATRLHLALFRHGIDSHFICCQQKEAGPNVHELPARGLLRVIQYVITRIVWVLGYLTPERRIVMPNLIPLLTLEKTLRKIKPDVVHIHWYMMDTISFGQLANMPCPVVITLHDLFDVNIEEPYPASDRRFIDGLSHENSTRYERWLFNRKLAAMQKTQPSMVGPSSWICHVSQSSIIGRHLHHTVTGNIFDKAFAFSRQRYLQQKKFRILFGANGGRTNPKKGWSDFIKALQILDKEIKPNVEVIVFGENGCSYVEAGINITLIGPLTNSSQLAKVYHDAEILSLPSKEDNAPNIKFESWLCGLPVVAFNRTGCAEHIKQAENGWIAADGDFTAFAKGIEHFYHRFTQGDYALIRQSIADSAASDFGERAITEAILRIYYKEIR